jgi:hypothetical protein
MAILTCGDLEAGVLELLLRGYGLTVVRVPEGETIPGSYWGESEAGLVGEKVFVRRDTPVHSALHEACHSICMGATRRKELNTDAGGDDAEESAVCYLQILLADRLPGVGKQRLMKDMDEWGYSFRLGSTREWFEGDAEDALRWLEAAGQIP